MKKVIFLLLATIQALPTFLSAQEKIDQAAIDKIKKEGLENSKVEDIAFHFTDYSGPRLTNSPGYKTAANWAVNELKTWGITDAHLEKWGEFGRGWKVEKSYFAMTQPYYMPLIGTPKAWTGSTNGPISGEVVLVDVKSDEDFKKYEGKLSGKIVLLKYEPKTMLDFLPDAQRFSHAELDEKANSPEKLKEKLTPEGKAKSRQERKLQLKTDSFLLEQDAKLVLYGRSGKHGTFFTSNGSSYKPGKKEVKASLEIAPEHAGMLTRLIEKGVPVTLEADIKTSFFDDDYNGYDVIGEIKGTDPKLKDELVMLGAHLDSWHAATGATDNAAGSIVMMEAIRILQASGLKPRRTIRIGLWSGEEQGILGSAGYVKNTFGDTLNHKPAYDKFSAYYNIDNGTGRIRGVYLQGNERAKPVFEEWLKPLADIIDHPTVTMHHAYSTDHLSFDAIGLPGFQFIQDKIEYPTRTHHTNVDTYERLVIDDLKQMAVVVASFVYNTAQRDEKLPRKEKAIAKDKNPSKEEKNSKRN